MFCVYAHVDLGLRRGGGGWWRGAVGVLPCWSTVTRLVYPSPVLCHGAEAAARPSTVTGAAFRRHAKARLHEGWVMAGRLARWPIRRLWLGAQAQVLL